MLSLLSSKNTKVEKQRQHYKTVGQSMMSTSTDHNNKTKQESMILTPWQALTSLIPLLKDMRERVGTWYNHGS